MASRCNVNIESRNGHLIYRCQHGEFLTAIAFDNHEQEMNGKKNQTSRNHHHTENNILAIIAVTLLAVAPI